MKKLRYFFVAGITLLLFCSCQMDAWNPYGGKEVYVSSGTPSDYNVEEFFQIAQSEFGLSADVVEMIRTAVSYTSIEKLIVRFVPLVYKTVDPAGREVLASGVVVYPLNQKARGVIDVLPFGYLANHQSAWSSGLSTEQVLVFLNQIIITPDMLDQGVSARECTTLPLGDDAPGSDMYHPILNMDNAGRVAYDMHIAAAQYFEKELGRKLPKNTSIFGYSEGAADALALNRWIDLHDNGNIIIDKTFSGGGAHDPMAAFEALRVTREQFYPIIPSILYSIDFWDTSINADYSKLFTGPLLAEGQESHFRDLYNRDHYIWTIKRAIYGPYSIEELKFMNSLEVYMHPDFFVEGWTNEGNEFQKFIPYLKYNNCTADPSWTPHNTIYLFHAVGDKHIPEVCTQNAYNNLLKKGANVVYDRCLDFENSDDPHMDGAIRFFVSCCGFFALN